MRRPSVQMFGFITAVIIFLLFYANTGMMRQNNVSQYLSTTAPSSSVNFSEFLNQLRPIFINVENRLCSVNFEDLRSHMGNETELKTIYFVTPTYPRPTQIPDLTRLSHTLMHVPNIHWIVADDQQNCSEQVFNILRLSGLPYTHLSSPKPYIYRTSVFPRGVSNRRAALDWIREHVHEGVLYFGDDDNTYDLRLFEEIRKTKKVGMLPVGLMGSYGVSSPVFSDGKVVAFYDSWPGDRTFPVDMAGFAVNIEHLPPTASMPYSEGLEEDGFLVSLGIKMEHIEPLADNCSKVYVWHTKTVKYKKPIVKINIDKLEAMPKYSAFVKLLKETVNLGMAKMLLGNGSKVIKNRKTFDVINGLH